MNNLINILSLDLDCNKSMPMINSSQFDKGRILVVSIAYKGEPFCVTGCEATLKCVHSNGTYTSLDCTDGIGEDGTTVTITFSDDTLPVQGVSSAKIVFTDGTRNYSTQIFLIDVDSCLEGNIKQSEPYSVLNRLIDQIIAIKNKIESIFNKKSIITNQPQEGDSDTNYPTVGAVRDFVNLVKSDLEDYVDDEIGSGAVTTAKLASGAVTTEKLGSGAVTAAKLGSDVNTILDGKVIKPSTSPNGTNGQILRTKGDGTTEWVDVGLPTDAQTAAAVSDWLDDHPEATTTVEDGSVTLNKLHSGVIDSTLSAQGAAAEAKATGDAIKNFYGYSSGTELSANTDLNSVTTGGVYLIERSVAASIQHSPFSSGGQILVVEKTTPASGAYCRQKIYQGASGRAFYRHINTSSIWSDWIDIENEIETIESNISSIESDINGLEGEIEYVQKNAAYYFDFKNAQLINASNGAPSSNANHHTTDYISVKSGETIYYSLRGTSNAVGLLYLYDTSKVAVECIAAGAGSTVTISGSYTFEQNGYIRVCCRNDFLDQSKVFFKTSVEYNTVKIAELERGIDLSVVGKYKNQIENTYSLSDWKRGGTTKRCLGLMMFSDLHGDVVRLQNAVQILNGVDSIDGAVFLGDMEDSNQSSNMASKYIPEFQKADKPCFAVMGNHDMHHSKAMSSNSNTLEQSVDRFIGQLNNASAYSAHGYGYYDFSTYKVRLILLNDYEYPDVNDGTDWTYYGSGRLYQQGQIDWLINTLNSVPSDYTVIIAQHTAEPSVADNNVINTHYDAKNSSGYFHGVAATQSGGQDIIGNNGYMSDTVIADIITAYIGKTTLTKSYSYSTTSTGYTGISVSADFSSANGKFACLICGHNHAEAFCKLKGTIPVYVNDTSNCQYAWMTGYSLIPRNQDGVSGDLITVLCIDTDNKYLHFCRIGADRTIFGEKYDVVSVPYT